MYVTLEPCQMCAGAIVQSRMKEVVIGCMNPKAGCAGSILNILQMKQFNHQVDITRGIMEEECSQMLKQFFAELRVRNREEKHQKREAEAAQQGQKSLEFDIQNPQAALPETEAQQTVDGRQESV